MEKFKILFVAGMQWWGRLEELLSKNVFHPTFETDLDEVRLCILSKTKRKHFDLVICADTVCPGEDGDGLQLAQELRRLGHKVLLLSDSCDTKGLDSVTTKEFHHDPVRMMGKIYRLVAARVRETTVTQ